MHLEQLGNRMSLLISLMNQYSTAMRRDKFAPPEMIEDMIRQMQDTLIDGLIVPLMRGIPPESTNTDKYSVKLQQKQKEYEGKCNYGISSFFAGKGCVSDAIVKVVFDGFPDPYFYCMDHFITVIKEYKPTTYFIVTKL